MKFGAILTALASILSVVLNVVLLVAGTSENVLEGMDMFSVRQMFNRRLNKANTCIVKQYWTCKSSYNHKPQQWLQLH